MYLLIYLVLIAIIYISSFKENFSTEHIQKVAPVLAAVTIGTLLLVILNSALTKR